MFGAEGGKPSFWKELIATALDQKSLQNGPEVSEEDFLVSLKKDPGAAVVHEDLFEGFSLEGIGRKALFLRNTQAEMIAKNPDSLTKLVQNFVQQPPKLVINLCVSKGFREHLCSVAKFKQEDISPGTVEKCAPFPLGNGKKEIAIGSDWLHKIKALQNYYCKDQNARISVKSQDGTPSSMFGDKPLSAKFQPLKALDLLRLRIEGSAVVRKGAKLVLDLQLEGPFVKNLGHLKKIKDKFEAILPPNSITKTRLRGKTEKEDIQEKVRRLKRQGRLSAKEQEQCIEEPVPRREDFPLEVSCGDGEFEKQIKYTPDWYERLKTVAFELVKQKRDAAASTDVQEKTWISLPGQAQTTEAPTEEDVWKEIELKTQKWAIAGSSASKRRLTLSALQEPSSEYELVFELKQDQFIKGREPYVEFSVADRNLNWQEAVALAELLRAQGADLKPVAGSTEAWHLPSQEEFPLEVEVGGLSKTEEKACEDLLENFISTTLLPLAAKTQALILCTAVSPICALTQALFRVLSTKQQAWGKELPFTILCTTANMFHLYASEESQGEGEPKPFWHSVRRGCRTWNRRDRVIKETMEKIKSNGNLPKIRFDLHSVARNFLFVDSLGVAGQEEVDYHNNYRLETYDPYNTLMRNLIKHLWKTVPVFAIKTAGGDRVRLQRYGKGTEPSTLQSTLDLLNAQIPVLWVDVRRRSFTKPADFRKGVQNIDMRFDEVVKEAKDGFTEDVDLIMWGQDKVLPDTFDACAIAYFLRVFQCCRVASSSEALRDPSEWKEENNQNTMETDKSVFTRMLVTRSQNQMSDDDDASETSHEQHVRGQDDQEMEHKTDVARWLSRMMFEHACKVSPAAAGDISFYEEHIDAMSHWVREIFISEQSYSINLHDGKTMLEYELMKLAMVSRLPEENGRKGDKLLAEAWLDYDIAMMLADRYKFYCHAIIALQNVIGWVTVGLSTYSANVTEARDWLDLETSNQILFALALATSAIITVEALIKSRIRWRQLRAHACTIKKTIWCYRTRIAPFNVSHGESGGTGPDSVLVEVLNEWRQSVMSSANLADTAFEQKYRKKVFKHTISAKSTMPRFSVLTCRCLRRKVDQTASTDEERSARRQWYAPVEPRQYIKMRLEKAHHFYTKRIPGYVGWSAFWQAFMIAVSIVGSVLAYFKLQAWLVVVVAWNVSCTSWVEFRDHTRKTARYTHVALGLRNLMTWWNNLTLVERASVDNIQKLVLGSEELLMTEMNAWISTSHDDIQNNGSNDPRSEVKSKPLDTE